MSRHCSTLAVTAASRGAIADAIGHEGGAVLTRLYVDNFRCFSNFELRPGRINLLLGPNGSGKSSILDILTALARLVRSGREVGEVFPSSSLTRWDQRTEQVLEADFALAGRVYGYSLRVEHRDGHVLISHERVSRGEAVLFEYADGQVRLHRNDGSLGTSFAFRPTRSFLSEIQRRPETEALMEVLDFLNGLRVLKLVPSAMVSVSHEESPTLSGDGSDFASWYRHLSQEVPANLHQLFENLRTAIPGFRSLSLLGAGKQGRTRDLVAVFQAPSGGEYSIDFEDLSDGQRVLIAIYTLLLDIGRGAGLVVLDEPENYVGLQDVQPWLRALDDALGDDGQLLLVSHHPEVIDYLAAERALLLHREGSGPARVSDGGFARDEGLRASEQIVRLGYVDAR